ncbi:hypothetical protein BJ165DRAFT_859010 [Panaeolus papilionaceus]|nr:hypothetical protein BJ165DRAFT_859010 [Panaeolus papilionaceus]
MKNRLVILAILQTLVYCQAPMPVCSNNSTYNWLYNSAGVSPCTIMTSLFQVCDPSHYFPALPLGSEYGVILGVNSDNACICNSVFYEISSACAYCQGRTWRTWSEYKTNCSTIYVQNFPYRLPGNTRVPSWAYVDVGESRQMILCLRITTHIYIGFFRLSSNFLRPLHKSSTVLVCPIQPPCPPRRSRRLELEQVFLGGRIFPPPPLTLIRATVTPA